MSNILYSVFAYSKTMELILFFLVNAVNFLYAYVITSVILMIFMEKVVRLRKLCFALIIVAYQTLTIYVPYVCSGFQGLGELLYFVSTPNPTFAVLFYFMCIKVFKVEKHRAIPMILGIYLFGLLVISLARMINFSLFPQQKEGAYNYMLDAASMVTSATMYIMSYFITVFLLRKSSFVIHLAEGLFVGSVRREIAVALIFASLAYFTVVFSLLCYDETPYGMYVVSLFMALALVTTLLRTARCVDQSTLQNNAAHINTLNKVITDFGAVKHDFYNVLGTYSGYIEIKDLNGLKAYHEKLLHLTTTTGDRLDFTQEMERNPSLCSLLIQKKQQAVGMGVKMKVSLHCSTEQINMDQLEFCRILACLLDNAVEAASEIKCGQVQFSMEGKKNGDKLIVITNSVPREVDMSAISQWGYTTKEQHQGIGLAQVRSIVAKNQSCGIYFTCYDGQFSAFLEIRNSPNDLPADPKEREDFSRKGA